MRKILILLMIGLCSMTMVFGSIVTNTNQSILFLRYPARNASTDIDAAYYNPAGTTHLSDGWHFSLNNQTIFQEKTVTNAFPYLNNDTFIGDVKAPIFPSAFVVYKKNKLAFSFGFGPNAGGGSAEFEEGLPSFETPISVLPLLVTSLGLPTTQYSADIFFKGSSIYFGFQLNASYQIHEMFSAALGLRYISANNTYEGSIENIMINPYHPLLNPNSNLISAPQFFNTVGMPGTAAALSNQSVDVKQVATGFTPILSAHINPCENLNIGLRYEFNTKLEFENQTTTDDTGMFPDGETFRSDIPAILAVGAEYDILPELKAGVSYTLCFDKNADWEGREDLVDSNSYEFAPALEYSLTDNIKLSAGYLWSKIDVSDDYQSDFSHELSSHSFFFGGRYIVNENLSFDVGSTWVSYLDSETTIDYGLLGSYEESYDRTTWAFGIAVNYHK
jgi:long-chain fatty acid transport protein